MSTESVTYTRSDIADKLAERTGIPKVRANEYVNLTFSIFTDLLLSLESRVKEGGELIESGDRVFISGLGSFRRVARKGRRRDVTRTLTTTLHGKEVERTIPAGPGIPKDAIVLSPDRDVAEALLR